MAESAWTVNFVDGESEQYGSAIVRATHGSVGLMLFIDGGGECEAFLSKDDSRKLREALLAAETVATSS